MKVYIKNFKLGSTLRQSSLCLIAILGCSNLRISLSSVSNETVSVTFTLLFLRTYLLVSFPFLGLDKHLKRSQTLVRDLKLHNTIWSWSRGIHSGFPYLTIHSKTVVSSLFRRRARLTHKQIVVLVINIFHVCTVLGL